MTACILYHACTHHGQRPAGSSKLRAVSRMCLGMATAQARLSFGAGLGGHCCMPYSSVRLGRPGPAAVVLKLWRWQPDRPARSPGLDQVWGCPAWLLDALPSSLIDAPPQCVTCCVTLCCTLRAGCRWVVTVALALSHQQIGKWRSAAGSLQRKWQQKPPATHTCALSTAEATKAVSVAPLCVEPRR
jgi:hypothetical protein